MAAHWIEAQKVVFHLAGTEAGLVRLPMRAKSKVWALPEPLGIGAGHIRRHELRLRERCWACVGPNKPFIFSFLHN